MGAERAGSSKKGHEYKVSSDVGKSKGKKIALQADFSSDEEAQSSSGSSSHGRLESFSKKTTSKSVTNRKKKEFWSKTFLLMKNSLVDHLVMKSLRLLLRN